MAKGERVPPDEVEVIVGRCGATLEALEEAVACHERRIELKAIAAGEAKAQATIDAINKRRGPLVAALEAAEEKLRAFDAQAAGDVESCQATIRSAAQANEQLLVARNLRPVALRSLDAARSKAGEAETAAVAADRAVAEAERSLREAEATLAYNLDHEDRSIAQHVETIKQNRTAVATRARRLDELQAAAASAARAAERARDALREARDAARGS